MDYCTDCNQPTVDFYLNRDKRVYCRNCWEKLEARYSRSWRADHPAFQTSRKVDMSYARPHTKGEGNATER
jgi:recombinational DNA repair protein (RecF pathway)